MSEGHMLWQQAASFAARAHRHELRKDGVTPYAAHPTRVALTIAVEFGVNDPEILAAAFLHDVIEDGSTDWDALADAFGERVANLVAAVSKDARLPEAEREEAYDRQLAAAPWEARLIKLADVFDNLSDSRPGPQRGGVREKVRRALALAEGSAELAPAANRVRALLNRTE